MTNPHMILIAAGRGSRLGHFTDTRPKCMVEVCGRSILDYQRRALAAHGVTKFHVIRGYLAHKLQVEGATYWENPEWESNNILHSLFCAEDAMNGSFLTSYSDIVYTSGVVEALLKSEADFALVVDTAWHLIYEGRSDHPVEQAELVEVDESGGVKRVGKVVGAEHAVGEFIGLAKFSPRGGEILKEAWHDVRAKLGDEDPFWSATLFRKAYLADMFQELVSRGVRLEVVEIEGNWREIDTIQDLERAKSMDLS